MKLTFKNYELVVAVEFLQGLELKGRDSRDRSKLVKLMTDALEDVQKDKLAIFKEYCQRDKNGELVIVKGEFQPIKTKKAELDGELTKLLDEGVELDGGMHVENIKRVTTVLNNLDVELSGKDAEIYDRILDELEGGE